MPVTRNKSLLMVFEAEIIHNYFFAETVSQSYSKSMANMQDDNLFFKKMNLFNPNEVVNF
jgi:hypothetical protein